MATNTTTSMSAPWTEQQPYLQYGFQQANQLYNQGGPQAYPGRSVAPISGNTQQALNGINYSAYNNPQQRQAEQYGQSVMGGQYLNANPYLDRMYDSAANAVTRNFNESVLPGVSARFGMSGRGGSDSMQNAVQGAYTGLAEGLSGMASNIYGGNYANERSMQQNQAQFTPQLLQSQAGLYNNALQAGQTADSQAQAELSDDVGRFQFEQNRPHQNLSNYMGNIGGGFGSQSSSTSPRQETPWYNYALGGLGLLGGLYAGR